MCDLFLAPEASKRDAAQQLFSDLFRRPESRSRLISVDRAGCDGVHADAALRPLDCERPRQVDDAGLRHRGVNGPPGPPVQA